jgi:hypothetical protein
MIDFATTPRDRDTICRIAERASALYSRFGSPRKAMDIEMDLAATHLNGCPLDLNRLEEATDVNLMHDVGGIARHLDRDETSETAGQLTDCFFPRFALRAQQLSDDDPAIMHKGVMKRLGRSYKGGQ